MSDDSDEDGFYLKVIWGVGFNCDEIFQRVKLYRGGDGGGIGFCQMGFVGVLAGVFNGLWEGIMG